MLALPQASQLIKSQIVYLQNGDKNKTMHVVVRVNDV